MTNSRNKTDTNATSEDVNHANMLNEWRRLNLSIKGQPDNYQRHSQRILFTLQSKLYQFLPGTLQDLFIALGENGRPLRERMFSLVLPLLDQSDREYFHEWLAHDSDKTLQCYRFPGAVLSSTTCIGDTSESDPFVAKASGTLIEMSRHAITYGRVETAQSLLEKAYTNSTTKPENSLIEELLSLYAATRQKDRLVKFAESLQQKKFKLSNHWKQVLESAKEW